MASREYNYEIDSNGVIHIPDHIKAEKAQNHEIVYLSDFMNRLPEDCFFIKGVTGNGATTLAIEDDDNFILAMPTRNTVMSKWIERDKETHAILGDRKDLFCVYGGLNDTVDDLRKYLDNRCQRNRVKIVCTYDQVGKILNYMLSFGHSPKKYRLYIDEVHEVLKDATNETRRGSIVAMMKAVPSFRSVTCITATPLKPEYNDFFPETAHLEMIRVEYDKIEWEPENIESQNIINDTRSIVLDHLEDRRFGNAHIFLNSVKSISSIIKRIDMEKYGSQIRIICGDYDKNTDRIRRAITSGMKELYPHSDDPHFSQMIDEMVLEVLGKNVFEYKGMKLSSINSEVKRVNFYTRTAWQGADVFDKTGQVYIISDGNNRYTMVDPSTDLKQILGRIRDSHNLKYIRIFKRENDRYAERQNNEYLENKALRTPEIIQDQIDLFQRVKVDLSNNEQALEEYKALFYLRYDRESRTLVEDKCLRYLDEINYYVRNTPIIPSAHIIAKFTQDTSVSDRLKRTDNKARKGMSFKAVWLEWLPLKEKSAQQTLFGIDDLRRLQLEAYDPLIVKAYDVIHPSGVVEADYNRAKIKRLIANAEALDDRERIYDALKARGVDKGARFYGSELTDICKSVQYVLRLSKPIKYASLFNYKTTTKRVDGRQVAGVIILSPKSLPDTYRGQ